MRKKKKGLLLRTTRQVNQGAIASGLGFLLYLGLRIIGLSAVSDAAVMLFALISLWVFVSAADLRQKDREAVSYNLLWGTGALAIMMAAFAALTIRQWLGLQ